jgi:hypothetical protein
VKLVGYRGADWGGGAFPSEQLDPRAAAAEHFTAANLEGFPEGMDAITECRISDWQRQQGWVLKRVGDPTTPEGWEVVEAGKTNVEAVQMLEAAKELTDEEGRKKLDEMARKVREQGGTS